MFAAFAALLPRSAAISQLPPPLVLRSAVLRCAACKTAAPRRVAPRRAATRRDAPRRCSFAYSTLRVCPAYPGG